MAWAPKKTGGVVIGILFFVCIIVGAMLVYRCRKIAAHKSADYIETPSAHDVEIPGPLVDEERPRSANKGQSGASDEWVRSSNPFAANSLPKTPKTIPRPDMSVKEQIHDRYPSLENGPGPVIRAKHKVAPPMIQFPSMPKVDRPGTSGSGKASSLRRAVLNVGGMDDEKKKVNGNTEKRDQVKDVKAKTYSGAWP